jgi:transposase
LARSERHPRRRIDRRDWTQYNRWQSEEVLLACLFLKDLVASSTVHDWERRKGRPRIPRRDLVLCLLVRAYFHLSFRRTIGLLQLLGTTLGIARVPHFNTLQKYNRGDGITRTLENLLAETARPFWPVEKTLAVDSSGLVLSGSGAWRSNHDPEARRDFAKVHVLSGTATRATLAVRVTRGTWHDATQLDPLLVEVPDDAVAQAITGDGAYWSHACCGAARRAGLQPYFSPNENARWPTHPEDAFERMTRFALQFPNRFRARYHRRSAAESRFATEKALFGDRLRCKRPTSRTNEVLAREIVHNVRLLTKGRPRLLA